MPTGTEKREQAVGPQRPVPSGKSDPDQQWLQIRNQFLDAIDPPLRPVVAVLLRQPRYGGAGLRAWVRALLWKATSLPGSLPPELIQVYLSDPEAMPLHDCEDCGLVVPVRPGKGCDGDGEPERVYFPTCPCCGGRTGLYAHCSNVRRRTKRGQDP
jgi:hypothetical protein